jgi:hypothetical protein
MPRTKTDAGATHAEEQVLYRAKLAARRAPEASRVDTAVAAAVALAFARLRDEGKTDPALEAIVADSRRILKSKGYNAAESGKKLMGRLLFRKDIDALKTVTTDSETVRVSPHYSRFRKRGSQVSRSEGDAS